MSYDWGPNFIVPSVTLKKFSGIVRLRETFDEEILKQELQQLELTGPILRITNPWYYRKKGNSTWIKIGESDDKSENFPVRWDTRKLTNGRYEVLGLMHIYVNKVGVEHAIARQSVVEVSIKN